MTKRTRSRIISVGLLATLLLLAGTEARMRLQQPARPADESWPLFRADNRIGYIPLPSQSGKLAGGRTWVFNELSMGVARPFRPGPGTDIALIGDSTVFGIASVYRQDERPGPRLEAITGARVWPISAVSWALQNELQYLRDHPQVVRGADRFVFVLNSVDFGKPSSWKSEHTHPTHRPGKPVSFLLYNIAARLKSLAGPPVTPPGLLVPQRNVRRDFKDFATQAGKPILLVFYPTRAELTSGLRCGFEPPPLGDAPGVTSLCLREDPRWNAGLYVDFIHVSPAGSQVMATIIGEALR